MRKTKVNKHARRGNNGITLIALVITIIVLLILAGVSIATLTGENGILTQANNAKLESIIAQEKEQLEIAYTSVKMDKINEQVTEEILQAELDKLVGQDSTSVTVSEKGMIKVVFNLTQHVYCINGNKVEEITDLIVSESTEGVKFTKADGVTPGDPNNIENGDIVQYGDYEYRFNKKIKSRYKITQQFKEIWTEDTTLNGWGVDVIDTSKNEYQEILVSLFGKDVVNLDGSFYKCENMEKAPKIRNNITSMSNTFRVCGKLKETPQIPNSVLNMDGAFYNCKELEKVINIPNSVSSISYTFYNCVSLEKVPLIPEGIINMTGTFNKCIKIQEIPLIPESVTGLSATFANCTGLEKISKLIPNSVTSLDATFSGCTGLKEAPEIPNSVTDMSSAFSGCTGLKEVPEIPNSVTDMSSAFSGCTGLKEAPEIPKSVTDMSSAFSGCTGLIKAPIIPESVLDLQSTFSGCIELTGNIEINAYATGIPVGVATKLTDCFKDTVKTITIRGKSYVLEHLMNTANNGNVTIAT